MKAAGGAKIPQRPVNAKPNLSTFSVHESYCTVDSGLATLAGWQTRVLVRSRDTQLWEGDCHEIDPLSY